MRELDVARITEAVAKLAVDACTYLGDDLMAFFEKRRRTGGVRDGQGHPGATA